ncbi:MAG: hypothetical protein D6713_00055 [Deltaproteobacteria bacterium]|nr:MAG: hypothetical protein D6713_00055 [Deltaproteobacteria bacterium]
MKTRRARAEAEKLVALSLLKRAQKLEEEGKAADAARVYARIFSEFPSVDFSPLAGISAGKAYLKGGLEKEGINVLEEVTRRHGGTPFEGEARRLLAKAYEKRGELEKAAENYRLIGKTLKEEEKGIPFLRKAGLMYFSLKSYDRAFSTFSALLSRKDAKESQVAEALYYAGMSLVLQEKKRKGEKFLQRAVAMGKKKGASYEARLFASRALLTLVAGEFEKYRKIRIVEPFEKTFRKKSSSLKKVISSYLEVARFGIPESLSEALFRIGEAYEEFKRAILEAPIPKGLSRIEQEEYIFLLEEKAAPFEEKAVETHRENLVKAAKNGYFNEWVERSLTRLTELRPGLYSKKPVVPLPPIPIVPEKPSDLIKEVLVPGGIS